MLGESPGCTDRRSTDSPGHSVSHHSDNFRGHTKLGASNDQLACSWTYRDAIAVILKHSGNNTATSFLQIQGRKLQILAHSWFLTVN